MIYFIAVLFVLTYACIIAKPNLKVYFTGISAVIACISMLISKDMSFKDILGGIDFNVLMMLVGIMLTVGIFSESNMPNKLSEKLISKISSAIIALILLSVLSGLVSAFVDNVATVLMLAPIGLAVAKKINVSPIPVLISIAVSSNLQGAATLVGDTTSIMLASEAEMSFMDFFFMNGKASIFWTVELSAIATIPILFIIFRKENKKLEYVAEEINVTSIVPTILLLLNFIALVVSSFVQFDFAYTNGLICMVFGLISVIFQIVKFKPNVKELVTKSVDFQTVFFLFFLFVLITAVDKIGIIAEISDFFVSIGETNVFLLYTVIVWGSVVISMFIDNIPYVATMLPVVRILCVSLGASVVNPNLLYFGLLIGATLGGNLSPVGASANVVAIGILNREGYKTKNSDFFKVGVPFTLVAVMVGYIMTYLIWGL